MGERMSRFSSISSAKKFFFDRPLVKRTLQERAEENLYKSAMRIKRIAQTSMRYVTMNAAKRKQMLDGKYEGTRPPWVSRPGDPPKAVRPHPWLRKNLFAAWDPSSNSAVIGPVRLGAGRAPETLEFGGTVTMRNPRRRIRKAGDGGEVRIGPPLSRTTKVTRDADGDEVLVTYARLQTGSQVERANRLNAELYGPISKVVRVDARPFMAPALAKESPRIASMWDRSISA